MSAGRPSRHRRAGAARAIAALCAVVVVAVSCGGEDDGAFGVDTVVEDGSATYDYTIPVGAGAAIDAGEPLEILPQTMTVTVGETIRIVNEDDRGHTIGPWYVGAGETLRQQFSATGVFEGVCSVHPSGEIVLEVVAA